MFGGWIAVRPASKRNSSSAMMTGREAAGPIADLAGQIREVMDPEIDDRRM